MFRFNVASKNKNLAAIQFHTGKQGEMFDNVSVICGGRLVAIDGFKDSTGEPVNSGVFLSTEAMDEIAAQWIVNRLSEKKPDQSLNGVMVLTKPNGDTLTDEYGMGSRAGNLEVFYLLLSTINDYRESADKGVATFVDRYAEVTKRGHSSEITTPEVMKRIREELELWLGLTAVHDLLTALRKAKDNDAK